MPTWSRPADSPSGADAWYDVLSGLNTPDGSAFVSRRPPVWVELPDSAGRRLKHGQLAMLALVKAQSPPALALPHSAVVSEGTRAFVFVRNPEGVFERRAVKTGRADDRFVEITEGLGAGETVAVGGAPGLQTAYAGLR